MELKIIVLIVVFLSALYSVALNIIRYRSTKNPTPESVQDVYDAETYAKWKKYSAEHCRVDMVSTAVSTLVSLLLLFTNAYSAFASLFPSGIHLQLLAVILLDVAVSVIVGVGFSYVKTMVIEEKYGFNRSTLKTFVFDQIRGLIIALLLSVGLAELMTLLSINGLLIIAFGVVFFASSMLISLLYPYLSRIGNKYICFVKS